MLNPDEADLLNLESVGSSLRREDREERAFEERREAFGKGVNDFYETLNVRHHHTIRNYQ